MDRVANPLLGLIFTLPVTFHPILSSCPFKFKILTANSCSECLVNPTVQMHVYCWFVSTVLLGCPDTAAAVCTAKIKRLAVLLLTNVTMTTKIKQLYADR